MYRDDGTGFDLAERALELCSGKGAVYASVTYRRTKELGMLFKNGSLSLLSPDTDAGISVRVATRDGVGFSSTNSLNRSGVAGAARNAASMARACGQAAADLRAGSGESAEWSVNQKIPLESVDTEQKIRRISDLDALLRKSTDLKSFRQISYDEAINTKYYIDTQGTRIMATDPKVELNFTLMMQKGADFEQAHRQLGYTGGFEALDELEAEEYARRDMQSLEKMLQEGRSFRAGKYDLVCGNEVTGIACHESCGHPMEADRIMGREASQAGKSFVTLESRGRQVGSELVTIVDDPTIPNSFGYYLYDDEGVKARRRVLYDRGSINEFLQNRESGARSGAGSNAAGRASSYDMEPLVRMANTFLLPGEFRDDELIGGVSSGVLLNSFNEWNIDDKRYNQKYVGREAYMIEKGEITHPVRSPVLEITTPGFWGAVDAVGRELKFFGGTCGKGDPMQGMEVNMGGPRIRLRGIQLK